MNQWNKRLLVAGAAGLITIAGAGAALAQSPVLTAGISQAAEESYGPGTEGQAPAEMEASIRVWGPVLEVLEDGIVIDNQSGISSPGEMVLHISQEESRVLDAVDGLPVAVSEIQVGEVVYANIGMAMTMSLPPQTNAKMVICQIPADFKAPEYIQVQSMQWNEDTSWTLTATNGTEYHVPADCPVNPYLTRNIVTLQDVTEARTLLVWSDAENVAQKLLLFAE